MMNPYQDTEYAIVGGGVVGLAVAYGLARLGRKVTVFDEGDVAFRASRGNFGLVWVQGKGVKAPHYARWTQGSSILWPTLARDLHDQTGIDVCLQQRGGYDFFSDVDELQQTIANYENLRHMLGGDYPFEVLEPEALRKEEPEVGHRIVGATLHQQDGHVNPLRLLYAFAKAQVDAGGIRLTDHKVAAVTPLADGYRVQTENGQQINAQKVVLCAGLGANPLAEMLGFMTRVKPVRGQNMVTEKIPPFMQRPVVSIRQLNEGGIQIGDSKERVGFDDRNTLATGADMAKRAVDAFPLLSKVKIVRQWSALRVMSEDGLPVYTESTQCPGSYMVTCHSGITLAAAHALLLPLWLEGRADAPDLELFDEQRFAT